MPGKGPEGMMILWADGDVAQVLMAGDTMAAEGEAPHALKDLPLADSDTSMASPPGIVALKLERRRQAKKAPSLLGGGQKLYPALALQAEVSAQELRLRRVLQRGTWSWAPASTLL
eukprot:CAMPEP_0197634658 /NCGR_PEP_ID=MMETSP1338-20131121/10686_1 /TAXON_ID=43686 ORGANISM="Pelagodinium beii, Strain RCC1491" /NCGR_SAMPLE_ID=MMETSP1338 /ASSEMBLY_ACC=CAM_ASM_000754 /LENGTH=115 /DNA_ID=CAMNT_0043206555 /DNA_START=64 /DNA_END=412 /DNA_ORIENTATION=+